MIQIKEALAPHAHGGPISAHVALLSLRMGRWHGLHGADSLPRATEGPLLPGSRGVCLASACLPAERGVSHSHSELHNP